MISQNFVRIGVCEQGAGLHAYTRSLFAKIATWGEGDFQIGGRPDRTLTITHDTFSGEYESVELLFMPGPDIVYRVARSELESVAPLWGIVTSFDVKEYETSGGLYGHPVTHSPIRTLNYLKNYEASLVIAVPNDAEILDEQSWQLANPADSTEDLRRKQVDYLRAKGLHTVRTNYPGQFQQFLEKSGVNVRAIDTRINGNLLLASKFSRTHGHISDAICGVTVGDEPLADGYKTIYTIDQGSTILIGNHLVEKQRERETFEPDPERGDQDREKLFDALRRYADIRKELPQYSQIVETIPQTGLPITEFIRGCLEEAAEAVYADLEAQRPANDQKRPVRRAATAG